MCNPAQIDPATEPTLTHDEWWALFDQLRLSQQTDYAECGDPITFLRKESDADLDTA